jgi:hypothetical protein
MHTLLEAYLDQVAAHLSALPVKHRNEELREMRQHLLNAVTVNQEMGQSEEDAAANAIMQFGTSQELGGSVMRAWRRGKRQNWKSFFGAALVSFLLLLGIALSFDRYEAFWPSRMAFILTRDFTNAVLVGTFTGLLFPRRAVVGTVFMYGSLILWGITDFFNLNYRNTPFPTGSYPSMKYLFVDLFYCQLFESVPLLLVGIFAAWLGSRWRIRQMNRSRLAQD